MRTVALLLAGFALTGFALASEPGVSDLGQGITAYNSRDFTSAVAHLRAARNLTTLSDYVTYHLAYSEVQTGDPDGALALLTSYRANPVASSPLAGKIDLLYGRTLLDKRDPDLSAKALIALQSDYKALPQPDGDFALGLAYEAAGQQAKAALAYERVFYAFPDTDLAAQSWTAMDRLRTALGRDFPEAPARQQLDRCVKWLDAKQYAKAREEYSVLAANLNGPEKDDARIGIGVSDYMAGKAPAALRYLRELSVTNPEADAERLYYVAAAARNVDDDTALMDAVKYIGEKYPKSAWRLKALVAAGEHFAFVNDRDKYVPLFKAAVADFPKDRETALSHWKLAWDAYQYDQTEKVALLREHVERYTDDSHVSTALYFLGRAAESSGKYAEARSYYERLSTQFPHYFYAVLARERMKEKVAAADPDKDVATWLSGIAWPMRRDFSASEPNAATARRIARARLLIDAGLPDLAEAEVRFGAKDENEQPQLLAMELAQSADSPYRALRIMKSFSADYLALPIDKAPAKFWQMLFPLPYKNEVFVNARERGLDPFDVAALIRQESEFNPGARSRANAYGLMQLRPATGRMVGRQQGLRAVSTRSLLNPDISIQLGTRYLRQQLDNWDGDLYRTLAAYNAGPGRVREWLMWSDYREPAEFVESIPFTETREYVQAVLRNADIYKQLYSGRNALEPVEFRKTPPVKLASLVRPAAPEPQAKAVAHTAASKKAAPKRTTVASSKRPASTKAGSAKTGSTKTGRTVVAKKSAASHTSSSTENQKKRDPA
jgi:soluble lytic murein transglycosylase